MKDFEIVFFDVGLGDCTLISINNKTVLIDGGGWFPDGLKAYLHYKHINIIDYIICTHFHSDHIDGLIEIMEKVPFSNVVCNEIDSDYIMLDSCQSLLKEIERANAKLHYCNEEYMFEIDGVKFKFIKPISEKISTDENCNSIVCYIEYQGHTFLIMSDLQRDGIDKLMSYGLTADIVRVAHHGMDDIPDDFWEMIKAKNAVISYGKTRHGVVNEQLLSNLSERRIPVHRTDLVGNIYVREEANNMSISYMEDRINDYGKKLLFLGANSETIKFIEKAKKRGIYTIVTDSIINSPAKKIADCYFDIDGKDIIALKELVKENEVDGVLVGVADPLVPTYMELCEALRLPYLPCYIKKENADFFTNKKIFKQECEKAGLATVPEFFSGSDFDKIQFDSIVYPCIVKPTCCRGGKGVSLCMGPEQLSSCFYDAKTQSDNDEVMIEAYMNMPDIVANFYFCDGEPHCLALSDRLTLASEKRISPVTYGNRYPAMCTKEFFDKCLPKFIKMFRQLRIRNGIMEVQIFYDGKEFYPYDPACILGGELSGAVFEKYVGIDLIDNFITYALYGNMPNYSNNRELNDSRGVAQSVWILLKAGQISRIEGIEKVKTIKGVLNVLQRMFVGDTVSEAIVETEKAALARVWVMADNDDELNKIVKIIRSEIKVYDENNNTMIMDGNV